MTYATVDDVKSEILTPNTSFTVANERRMLRDLHTISRRIEQIAGMDFDPRYNTRRITATSQNVNSQYGILTLDYYLLEVDSIVNDGTTLAYNTNVFAYPRNSIAPITALRLLETSDYIWYPCGDSQFETILITGWEGYRQYYSSEGFIASGETLPVGGIDSDDTSWTASDVDGTNSLGDAPRFSPGNLLRIEDELLEVVLTNTSTNVVTVRRGVNGTTAAAHAAGTAISVWNVEPDIRYVAARAAAYNYSRRGAFNTAQQQDFTTITYPADFPAQVRAAIQGYAHG